MKSTLAIIILVLVCLGLGVALIAQKRNADRTLTELQEQVNYNSNEVVRTSAKLEEQTQVNTKITGDLDNRGGELKTLSNNLAKVIADLEKSDAQAKSTAEQLRTAQAELAKKDQKITEMESERAALGKQMDQLTNSITDLEKLIATTEKKLATSQGEKDFLLKELNRLRAEKAELERQFNDIAVLRAQVSKLKEDMAISRRLEFIRLNLFGGSAKGGASQLMTPPRQSLTSGTNYDLNVELRQGGEARVVAPTNAPVFTNYTPRVTNAPAAPPK
jgi:septal ring factor EnvC (AmiA/AmiB activator)